MRMRRFFLGCASNYKIVGIALLLLTGASICLWQDRTPKRPTEMHPLPVPDETPDQAAAVWGVVNRGPIEERPVPQQATRPPAVSQTTPRPAAVPQSSAKEPAKFLLIGFYRGGSSLAGDIFNKDPGAMYLYEPLGGLLEDNLAIQQQYGVGGHDSYTYSSNGTAIPLPDDLVDILLQAVVHILNCDFYHLDKVILRHYFITEWTFSHSTQAYRDCIHDNADGQTRNNISDDAINKCIPKLREVCVKAEVRAMKTIRMGLYEISRLLELDPSIHVIYYPRDPRSQMQSTLERAPNTPHEYNLVTRLCDRMRQDAKQILPLTQKYPDNLLMMRYEDLVLQPRVFESTVYKSVGKEVPKESDEFIQRAVKETGGFVENWRKNITQTAADVYLEKCADVFEFYNYTKSMMPPIS